MSEDNKRSRYSEAQNKATQKYIKSNYDEFKLRLPKGQKAIIKAHADAQGESMNAFVIRAIDETMKKDS
ncbi:putative HicB family RNase H-like nuclease [Lachnospiraceae bacterium PM6-15]|uniref:Arc family DNA-binding protein n=1 Tax=Ohessyouella blattaphilus TaxID=2949333 RepID=UPI003E30CF87